MHLQNTKPKKLVTDARNCLERRLNLRFLVLPFLLHFALPVFLWNMEQRLSEGAELVAVIPVL